jgi:hypothetical protein
MYIPRLLVLPVLISVFVAPVEAQSSPDKSPIHRFLLTLPQDAQAGIRADHFQLSCHPDGINQSHNIFPLEVRAHVLPLEQSDVTCYSIRTYRVTRDDPESDSTRPAGYSTCEPAARFRVKDAGDSSVQASFP